MFPIIVVRLVNISHWARLRRGGGGQALGLLQCHHFPSHDGGERLESGFGMWLCLGV